MPPAQPPPTPTYPPSTPACSPTPFVVLVIRSNKYPHDTDPPRPGSNPLTLALLDTAPPCCSLRICRQAYRFSFTSVASFCNAQRTGA